MPSSLLRDYHTANHQRANINLTRKQELSEKKLNTVLSSRDFAAVIADAEFIISDQQALQTPVYSLCLGKILSARVPADN